ERLAHTEILVERGRVLGRAEARGEGQREEHGGEGMAAHAVAVSKPQATRRVRKGRTVVRIPCRIDRANPRDRASNLVEIVREERIRAALTVRPGPGRRRRRSCAAKRSAVPRLGSGRVSLEGPPRDVVALGSGRAVRARTRVLDTPRSGRKDCGPRWARVLYAPPGGGPAGGGGFGNHASAHFVDNS